MISRGNRANSRETRFKSVLVMPKDNQDFRKVVFTGKFAQVIQMCIPPNEEMGQVKFPCTDLVLFVVDGDGSAVMDSTPGTIRQGDTLVIPAGTPHNLKNTGKMPLRLCVVCSPPEYSANDACKTLHDVQQATWKALEHAWEQ